MYGSWTDLQILEDHEVWINSRWLISKVIHVIDEMSLASANFLLVRLNMLQNFTVHEDYYAHTETIFDCSRWKTVSL